MSTSNGAPNGASNDDADLHAPRLYQSELLMEAKAHKNIIIRADTGSGKTLVALLLIRWIASQARPLNEDGTPRHTIQVFLCPTRPLVHQQADLLRRQTNLRITATTGEEEPQFWKLDKWKGILEGLDVLVCTHQILLDILSKGFWSIEDISLIVFDEAHHCQKKHPYVQIMQAHYQRLREQGSNSLPRILGLTASPIWSFKGIEQARRDVEKLQANMSAKLYEVRHNREDLQQHSHRPRERVIFFESSEPITTVRREMEALGLVDEVKDMDKLYSQLDFARAELGSLAEVVHARNRLRQVLASPDNHFEPSRHQRLLDQLALWETQVDQCELNAEVLSPKVVALVDTLAEYRPDATRKPFLGIVFLERRLHVELLTDLLMRHPTLRDFLRPVALVGHGGSADEKGMDSKSQNVAVASLRTGDANLAVATSVAEEGLDFPALHVCIRFDEIKTWKGYQQARGRARAAESDYLIFIPQSEATSNRYFSFRNDVEERLKTDVFTRPDEEAAEDGEVEDTPQHIIQLEDGNESVLTYSASPGLLSDVCQLLPHDDFTPIPRPTYELSVQEGPAYVATVTVPTMTELPPDQRQFRGRSMPTKKAARRSAAYEACLKLLEVDVLTKNLLPRREDLDVNPTDADGNTLNTDPIPESVAGLCPNPFDDLTKRGGWLHKLVLVRSGVTSEIGFVCGSRLKTPPGLFLYDHEKEYRSVAVQIADSVPLRWKDADRADNVARLDEFTKTGLQICVTRRPYDGDLLFWLAPLLEGRTKIDWDLVDHALEDVKDVDDLLGSEFVLVPQRALHYRLLKPISRCDDIVLKGPPDDLPEIPSMHRFRRSVVKSKLTSLDHYLAITMGLDLAQTSTPLVYLDSVLSLANNLRPPAEEKPVQEVSRVVLPTAVCRKSRVPLHVWKTFCLLPAISRILHDASQASLLMEASDVTEYDCSLVVEALTQPGNGTGFDYQSLETVGDAFLKLATSVHLYITRPDRGEGTLSALRSRSIDNAYLRGKAVEADLADYILGQRFRTDQFRAAHLEGAKELPNGKFKRRIPKRVLSDVVEATLGAVYLSAGITQALHLGTAYQLCFGGPSLWSERHFVRGGEGAAIGPAHIPLQEQLGYRFENPHLLVQALTHRSANSFHTGCYEREEWLGDACLDMWITERLYRRFPGITAEQLTFMRASIVNNGSLGFIALRKLALHKVITHNASTLERAYERSLEELKPFETIASFYEDHTNAFVAYDPPKIAGDCVEALIGAIFVDCKFDLQRAYEILDHLFVEVLPVLKQSAPRDPLSRLLALRDRHFCTHLWRNTRVEVTATETEGVVSQAHVCEVYFHDQSIAVGRHATSVSVAEQRAAKAAGVVLADEDFWTTHCQCAEIKLARDEEIKAEKKRAKQEALVAKQAMEEDLDDNEDAAYESAEEGDDASTLIDQDGESDTPSAASSPAPSVDMVDASSRASSPDDFRDATELLARPIEIDGLDNDDGKADEDRRKRAKYDSIGS